MLKNILNKGLIVVLLLFAGYLWIVNLKLKHERHLADLVTDRALSEAAKSKAFTQWKAASEGDLVKGLSAKLAKSLADLRAVSKGVKVTETHESTVTLSDTAKGTATATSVEDEYGRFHFDLPSGVLTRKQKFSISSVIVRSPDGKYRFEKNDFREFSPKDGREIPTAGAEITGNFKFLDEKAATAEKPLRPRFVLAVDHRAAIGAGVTFLDWKHLDISVLGFYDRKTQAADVAISAGYRLNFPLIETNLAIGPYFTARKTLGAALTVQLTR